KKYTAEGLAELTELSSNVRVFSYQALEHALRDILFVHALKKVALVVFDEAHFFTSDAAFNGHTERILEQIAPAFSQAMRVYTTATPDDAFEAILEAESSLRTPRIPPRLFMTVPEAERPFRLLPIPPRVFWTIPAFEMKADYSHLDIWAFRQEREVIDMISKDTSSERWFIFLNSVERGRKLAQKLPDAAFICAESKDSDDQDGEVYRKLLEEEKFDAKVLVTTAVLDNGINIIDPTLRNVVLFSTEKAQFLQALGRKRCAPDERLRLFLPAQSSLFFNGKARDAEEKLAMIKQMREHPYAFAESLIDGSKPKAQGLGYWNGRKYVVNGLAETNYKKQLGFYKTMREDLKEDPAAFVKAQMAWLGLEEQWSEEHWLGYVLEDESPERKTLQEFLKNRLSVSMENEEVDRFCQEFQRLAEAAFGPRDNWKEGRGYKETIIRKILGEQGLPYRLDIRKGCWTLSLKEQGGAV
ncbi:MAG: hypothetical protein PUC47_11785, partial [Oscillospiraceae bacterium]|nr:hypothetical protein [Oscillospiraceae bacterium]